MDIACKLHVASRRLHISQVSKGLLNVSVVLESFDRLYETNMLIMNPSTVSKWLSNYNFTTERISKTSIQYINDTADYAKNCPSGYYFSNSAYYTLLPQHAIAGPDCYDLLCMEGYDLTDNQCIPSNVTQNIIWVCVLLSLLIVVSVSVAILCIKLATWEKFYTTHTFYKLDEEGETVDKHSSIIANVVFDDHSKDMLDEMFSSDENSLGSESDNSDKN